MGRKRHQSSLAITEQVVYIDVVFFSLQTLNYEIINLTGLKSNCQIRFSYCNYERKDADGYHRRDVSFAYYLWWEQLLVSYLSSFYITHSSSQAPSSFLAHQSPGSRFHEAQGPWGSMAYPLLITATKQEQNKMGTSMRESWERTRSHLYSIISTRRSLSQA